MEDIHFQGVRNRFILGLRAACIVSENDGIERVIKDFEVPADLPLGGIHPKTTCIGPFPVKWEIGYLGRKDLIIGIYLSGYSELVLEQEIRSIYSLNYIEPRLSKREEIPENFLRTSKI